MTPAPPRASADRQPELTQGQLLVLGLARGAAHLRPRLQVRHLSDDLAGGQSSGHPFLALGGRV